MLVLCARSSLKVAMLVSIGLSCERAMGKRQGLAILAALLQSTLEAIGTLLQVCSAAL